MNDEERKRTFDELFKQVLAALIQDVERARKENQKTRKMQDFIIEKMTVEITFKGRRLSLDWVSQGIDHYIKLGTEISRNDILTKLTERITKFKGVEDPKKIEEIVRKYKEHEKEILGLLKPHVIEVMKPRF